MEISREALMQYADKPEFSAVIDMLIDAGLLAGHWTADELFDALERLEERLEIAAMFDLVPANARVEEQAFQAYLEYRHSRTGVQRKWRSNPENVAREKKNDKRRQTRLTHERRLARKKAHHEFLHQQRVATKAKLKSRCPSVRKVPHHPQQTVGWQWESTANRAIA